MKRPFSPFHLALFLVMGCILFRVIKSEWPEFIPNISPLMAIAYVGAMYLPRRWGWLVGPSTLVITELAFLRMNYLTGGSGSMFSSWMIFSFLFYCAAGGFGLWIARHQSLGRIVGGSLLCSLLFYLIGNTFAWWQNLEFHMVPSYSPGFVGWVQANTVGLPGLVPTWVFLRNGMGGDLFFALLLLLVLDRDLLFGAAHDKAVSRTATV